ncbi:phosphoribosylanthranilate isomerase [Leucobacter chromiireducens]|uniref:N-(5'-phosphoribosyl)anthranilate isomerase n=1 Tax=Leucobacter chromiireducens subsp. chromiireducens TaxID=660067 RepID=A0ABS1SR57_9MICO|nr:phosphoribosylanthranilate isomerase [Leucobacter chromiireducens]MBL3690643.1 phosphoribosylanthranilate isomerase [Leucobacter chromiireducens subsp. chromiireducens]
MYVKICGLRDAAHGALAASLGADAVGVVMSEGSPRNARPEEALAVIAAARAAASTHATGIDTVLVVSRTPAREAAELARDLGFDVLQLHGRYSHTDIAAAQRVIPRVWRAASLAHFPELRAGEFGEERLLVDGAVPGSGETWDLSQLDPQRLGASWVLAGGLAPENVAAAIRAAHPGGVDVSSGVESAPGLKDPELIRQFIAAARQSQVTNA